jgi:hypothetical protein
MVGCFFRCSDRGASKSKSLTKVETDDVISLTPPIFRSKLKLSFQRPSDEETQVTPSTAIYAIEGGKELAKLVRTMAVFVPLPLVGPLVSVGIKVLEACEVCLLFLMDVYIISLMTGGKRHRGEREGPSRTGLWSHRGCREYRGAGRPGR